MTLKPPYPVNYSIRMDLTCLVCAVLAVGAGLLLYAECAAVLR